MKEKIFQYILELEKNTKLSSIPTKLSSWIKSKANNDIYQFLMNDDQNFGDNFLQRLFNIRYNVNELPKCKICGNNVDKFISYSKGYKQTCSKRCTNILIYGCEHPMKSKDVQSNLKKSLIEKYGVDEDIDIKVMKE